MSPRHKHKHRSKTKPIDTVPAELLLKIFHAFVEPRKGAGHYHTVGADVRHRRSVVLTHVCRGWRILTLSEASLWADIRVTGTAKLEPRCFERSRPLPIDLTIDLDALARRPAVKDCVAIVGRASGLISQPKQDRARIHSIRATLHRGSNVESLATLIKGLKASALSELFIKTTSAADLGPIELQRHYSSLLPMTLTTLELHIGSQVVDGDLVKQALERCPGLTSLVLGGLFLDTSGLQTTNSPNDSPIHAPALRRLALGTPIFHSLHNRAECNNDCPCPFRKLVVDKLEYLEVAGDSVRETLPHLLPFIQRRLSKVGQSSTAQPPLALIINSGTSFSLFNNGHDKDLMRSLPRDVHLHLLNDDSDYPRKPNICEWFQSTRSTVLYLQRSQTQKSLAGFRRLQPRGGLVPVIIHPSGNASQHIQDGNAEARGWVLSGSDANGPFMNPNQPSIDDDVYGYEYGYLDDDEDMYSGGYSSDERFDWQEYRRSLGWPDGYDTPSP